MPLQAQTVNTPLSGGIDTKTDPKYVAAGQLLSAQNVQFFGVQRASKRFGQTALSQQIGAAENFITSGNALGVFNQELLEFDGKELYGYGQSQNAWFPKAPLTEVLVSRNPIIRSSGSVSGIASGVAGALEIYAWEDTRGGIYYAIRDSVSGSFVVPNQSLDSNGVQPQIVTTNNFLYITYLSGNTVVAVQISLSNPAAGINYIANLVTGASGAYAIVSSPTTLLIAFQGASGWSFSYFNQDLSLIADTVGNAFSIGGTPTYAQLSWDTSTYALLSVVTASGAFQGTITISGLSISASNPLPSSIGASRAVSIWTGSGQNYYTYWDLGFSSSMPHVTQALSNTNSGSIPTYSAIKIVWGLQVASQPQLWNGIPYIFTCSALVNLAGATSQQTTFYLVGGTTAVILQRFSGDGAFVGGTAVPLPLVTSTGFFVGLTERTALRADENGTIYSQTGLTEFRFTFPTSSQLEVTQFGNTALINCGNTYTYDGSYVVESGFWEFPDGISATLGGTGNGLSAGLYLYQVTYEWTDSAGNTHYSAPSYPSPSNGTLFKGGGVGTNASYQFIMNGQPNVNDTFTVGGLTFTAIANGAVPTAQQFPLGVNVAFTAVSIAAAVNAVIATGVTAFPFSNTVIFTAITPGAAGNSIEFSSNLTGSPVLQETFGIVVPAGGSVVLTVPYTALTLKTGIPGNANVCIYRTTVNQSSPYYKVGSFSNGPGLVGTPSFTFVDTQADVVIQTQQMLYAPADGSGELENDPPPPFQFLTATKTRMFGIAQDDPTALWYSKPLNPGRPSEWSGLQIVRIETAGGLPTGLSYLNTQAVVFKQQRIYFLPGDGPNAGGQPANGFPQTLSTISATTGCINGKSILPTYSGLYYQSPLCLELLDTSLTPNEGFGLPVQGALSGLTLSGAAAIPAQNQLRWTSTQGTALVYDYVTQRWMTYTNYAAVGYVFWNNTGVRLNSSGMALYEDTTTYLDNTQPIQMLLETAWLKLSSMTQGFAALWYAEILGTYQSPHTLNVEVAWDYIDAPVQHSTFNATLNGNLGTYGSGITYGSDPLYGSSQSPVWTAPYQVRLSLQRQVGEAVKFKIYDSSITGQSCDLNEIALQLGVMTGLNRVPLKQQV